MHIYFLSFWWLVFPTMWTVSRLLRMWWLHRQHTDALGVAREYIARGQPIPPEISRILAGDAARFC